MKRYGLIGHPLKHSQSRFYFNEKFEHEGLDCRYQHFDLKSIEEIVTVYRQYKDAKTAEQDSLEILNETSDPELRELAQAELDEAKENIEKLLAAL